MIDEKVFKDSWVLLCDRFNREASRPLMLAYYRALSPVMDTARFREACNRIFRSNEFFPKPDDFLHRDGVDRQATALEAWEQVHDLMRGFLPLDELDPEARRAVDMMGGERKLRNTPLDAVQYVRRDFMDLYGDAVAIAEREGRRIEGTEEGLRITREIMQGRILKNPDERDTAA